jgi:hypothetical protein
VSIVTPVHPDNFVAPSFELQSLPDKLLIEEE